ncbi:MAG TPA: hypothetical protein VGG06_16805 [Thermoanaerobaculia bacterium]|jgi:hypothetical protein
MSDEVKCLKEESEADLNVALDITFSGLCSFVDQPISAEERIVNVLLVEARRSKVQKKLCRHDRYLLFRAGQLVGVSGSRRLYRSLVGPHPNDEFNKCTLDEERDDADRDSCELTPDVYCVWDIDGCDLTISAPLPLTPNPIEFNKDGILNLDQFEGDGVAPRWLSDRHPGRLIGSRVRLRQGRIKAGGPVCGDWAMCTEIEECDSPTVVEFCETVNYQVDAVQGTPYVEILAQGYWRSHWIRLAAKSKIFISNLCPADPVLLRRGKEPIFERDVLSYYELCESTLAQHSRKIPRLVSPDVTPNKSACPPVVQSAA